ncbi:MAG: glycosyltransferase family 1 protein [Planctomycetes bacterium]|nr:glycosyltransferase family 1 protein [Planctomycetota bacterium]
MVVKIAFIARTTQPRGGTESYLFDIVAGCKRAGHEVHVFTSCFRLGRPIASMGVKVHRIPLSFLPKSLRLRSYRFMLSVMLKKTDYDLTISVARIGGHDLTVCGGTHLGFLRSTGKSISLKDKAEILEERHSYKDSSLIVPHSPLMQAELEELYGVNSSKVRLFYPPVNVLKFGYRSFVSKIELKKRFGLSSDRKTLLFPSTSHARKGLPLLVEALGRLPEDQFELVVAGLKSDSARLPKNVKFLGFVKSMEDLYCAADITVLPSHYEPFGLVITESIACGTPVVLHNKVGAHTLVTEREGISFSELNPQSLSAAILQASSATFDIDKNFCVNHSLTVDGHVARLILAGQEARKSS